LIRHIVEYLSEALALASVILIWVPAFKATRILRFVSSMEARQDESRAARTRTFVVLYGELADDARASLQKWSRLDHWMLLSGILCAAASSVVKLFYLLPTQPPC
jgi:hypothetical protein